jgi:carbonic anhydrase/acetyltransferase-like protein (isoleucine patch superfamily)
MSLILPVHNIYPTFGKNCFLAPNATIAGQVIMGDECSVWFNAVVRGDVNTITIGNRVNIQDNAVIHCTYQKAATIIGDNVSIGHSAIVHGCTIHQNVLVGMGAIIMDHALVHENVLIGAGSIVLENTILESGFIYAGAPAKKIKELSAQEFKNSIDRIAKNYVMYAGWFADEKK